MMKLLGQLLMTFALMGGAFAAATAYTVNVNELSQEELAQGLTLNENVGRVEVDETEEKTEKTKEKTADKSDNSTQKKKKKKTKPLAAKGQRLTPELVESFQAHKLDGEEAPINYVRVQQFSFSRWRYGWLFLLSFAVMIGGALMARYGGRVERGPEEDEVAEEETPAGALSGVAEELASLEAELGGAGDKNERMQFIIDRLGELQQTHLAAFVDGRYELIAQYGLARVAELMDYFSSAERHINRAWTAASDGDEEEALDSLEIAIPLIAKTQGKLQEMQQDTH